MPRSSPDPAAHDDTAPGASARGFSFALEESAGRLCLRALHRPAYGLVCADWTGAAARSRVRAGRRQALARAVGLGKADAPCVLDATAGLGRDGFTLAALGARVILVEREALVVALLRDARRRALADPATADAAARIQIVEGDAAGAMTASTGVDTVYLDPMYPHSPKSALPAKEMQFFRELTGGDADAGALLAPALACARNRVVVKRPQRAAPLAGRPPDFSVGAGLARFDVYRAGR